MTTQTQKFALIKYAMAAVSPDAPVDKDEMFHQRRLKVLRVLSALAGAAGGGVLGAGQGAASGGSALGGGLLGAGIGGGLGYGAGVVSSKLYDYMGLTPFMPSVQTVRR